MAARWLEWAAGGRTNGAVVSLQASTTSGWDRYLDNHIGVYAQGGDGFTLDELVAPLMQVHVCVCVCVCVCVRAARAVRSVSRAF